MMSPCSPASRNYVLETIRFLRANAARLSRCSSGTRFLIRFSIRRGRCRRIGGSQRLAIPLRLACLQTFETPQAAAEARFQVFDARLVESAPPRASRTSQERKGVPRDLGGAIPLCFAVCD